MFILINIWTNSKHPWKSIAILGLFLTTTVNFLRAWAVLKTVEMPFPISAFSQAFKPFQISFRKAIPNFSIPHWWVVKHYYGPTIFLNVPDFPAPIAFFPAGLALLGDMACLITAKTQLICALGMMMIPQTKHTSHFGFHIAVLCNVTFLAASKTLLWFFLWEIILLIPLICIFRAAGNIKIAIHFHFAFIFTFLSFLKLLFLPHCLIFRAIELYLFLFFLLLFLHLLHFPFSLKLLQIFLSIHGSLPQMVFRNIFGGLSASNFIPDQMTTLVIGNFHSITACFCF